MLATLLLATEFLHFDRKMGFAIGSGDVVKLPEFFLGLQQHSGSAAFWTGFDHGRGVSVEQ